MTYDDHIYESIIVSDSSKRIILFFLTRLFWESLVILCTFKVPKFYLFHAI
jgi:hypothetical protein